MRSGFHLDFLSLRPEYPCVTMSSAAMVLTAVDSWYLAVTFLQTTHEIHP